MSLHPNKQHMYQYIRLKINSDVLASKQRQHMYQYIRLKVNSDVFASKQRETTHVAVH